jgi:uncharacterized membrane protein YccF (DUF307 family)
MSLLSLLLNVLWVVTGGLWMAVGWVIAGVLLAVTVVGLPWAFAAFRIAAYTLLPFGYRVMPREETRGRPISPPDRSGCSATSSGWCWAGGGWHSRIWRRR